MSRSVESMMGRTPRPLSRRQFVQGTAALGLSVPFLAAGRLSASAQDGAAPKITFASPRGALDVIDDYPYWIGQKYGYFGDLETAMEPATTESTSSTKAVDAGLAQVAYPSPGVLSDSIQQGIDLLSIWEMGAYDVFDIGVPKGSGITDLKQLEGKTMSVASAGWAAITNPMFAQAGADHTTIEYIQIASWPQALANGQVDSTLGWEGLRAEWKAQGLDFDYILGKDWSKFPANSLVVKRSDMDDPALVGAYTQYLRGWAMGLEFGYQNPRAATQICLEQFPSLAEKFEGQPEVAVESQWELATVFRGDWATRQGWGWHDPAAWDLFLKITKEIGQLTADLTSADVLTNDFVAGANAFDLAKVKADAMGFTLSPELEAVPVPAGAGS